MWMGKKWILAIPAAVALMLHFNFKSNAEDRYSIRYATRDHREIIGESMDYHRNHYPALFSSLTDLDIENMKTGAYDEDLLYIRSINHFYDFAHNKGLTIENVSLTSAKEWAFNQSPQVFGGRHNWVSALENYRNIAESADSREKAFVDLGHVLHLIQDITVPAHTRNDQHYSDRYEDWSTKYFAGKFHIDQDGFIGDANAGSTHLLSGSEPMIDFNDLGEYFDDLSKFTQENFYSDSTVDNFTVNNVSVPDPENITLQADTIINNPYDNNIFNGTFLFYYREIVDDGKVIRYRVAAETIFGKSTKNIFVIQDYYKILYRKAMLATAGVVNLFLKEVSATPARKTQ